MEGYPRDGNQDEDFSAAAFGNYSGYANDASFGNHSGGGETRDFLSQPVAYSPMFGVPSSSNPFASQLRLDSLNLNAGQSWADMDTYQGILQSGAQEGSSGSFNPPPLRVPSRSGRGSLGLRPPRSGGVGGGRPTPRGDSGSGGAGRVPPRQRGSTSGDAGSSRGRGARRRLEQVAAEDSMPPPQVPNKLDRAQWSDYHTKVFCQLYYDQIDMGYCNRGQMTKWGWQNITEEYFKRTKLVHDNVIFGSKVRALKKEWRAIRDLQIKETGLGRSADGSINASDQWWEENNKDHQKELKDGLPEYLPEMDKMFECVCVTGETSYVPGRRNGPHNISSDEEEDGGDTTPHSTPHSTGSKRSFSSISTRSTGTNPSKKSRSPAVRAMQSSMRDFHIILENRTAAQNQIWADRQKREEQLEEKKRARRKRVREMAR